MTITDILSTTWITLLIFIVCSIDGLLLIKTNDIKYLWGMKGTVYKDKEKFVAVAGKLILALGVCGLVMSVLLLVNTIAASVFGSVAFLVFAVCWKRSYDKYGPKY